VNPLNNEIRLPERRGWAIRRPHPDLEAMHERAQRVRGDGGRRPRRRVRLWLPLTPFLILLSPIFLLAMAIAVFLPRPFGVNPASAVLGVGRVLLALNGSLVEVESPAASVLIKIL
jgi:hypothetical protein